MLKAIVVDDELPAREELKYILEEMPDISVIADFEDGAELMDYLKQDRQVDVVFLDVQMRRKDGITTAGEILQLPQPPYVVFLTGFGEHAVKAFELNAVDYILKPFSEQRLRQTVKKLLALQKKNKLSNSNVYQFLSGTEPPGRVRLSVWANDRMVILQPSDIVFVKIDEDGKTMICSTKGKLVTKLALKEIEQKLSSTQFFRTHKSFLVNLDKISEVEPWFNNTYMLTLEGCSEERVPVARHYMKDFNKAFERI